MLNIYTENFFVLNRIKNFIKILLGMQNRGPKAVEDSLLRGLEELSYSYEINFRRLPINLACVISGSQTLRWAIEQKKKGLIKKIIAGPNMVVFPEDSGGVLTDPAVDVVVVPSLWVKNLYCRLAPKLADKIRIWPAGIAVPKMIAKEKKFDFLVYDKTKASTLRSEITNYLKKQGYKFKILTYGQFQQAEYFELLEESKYEIYLSQSESQGLGVFEAWARNVPALVWERGYFEYKGFRLDARAASPYLAPQTGNSFRDFADFPKQLEVFLLASHEPRRYMLENFTDTICAQKYLDIVHETQNNK